MKKIFFPTFILSVLIFVSSCGKDKNEFIPTQTIVKTFGPVVDSVWDSTTLAPVPLPGAPPFPIEKLLATLEKPVSKDSVDAEKGGLIILPDDVTVDIPSDCCVYGGAGGGTAGQPVKGKIEIEVVILRTKGELVSYNKPTIAALQLLTSGGVALVRATQNGVRVELNTGKKAKIKFKTSNPDAQMTYFFGNQANRTLFDWTSVTNRDNARINTWADSSKQNTGYEIITDRFGWINCDKFNGETNLTNKFCATLPDSFTNKNTGVFVIFKDILSVVRLVGNPAMKQFCIPPGYRGLPIGKPVILVSVSELNGKYYFAAVETTITEGGLVKMTPVNLTLDELKLRLKGL